MKKLLLTIFIMIIIIVIGFHIKAYFFQGHIIQIKDIAEKQIIALIEKDRPQYVHGISILITGYIDGTATIQRAYENQKMYEPSSIGGKVNLRLGGDWYGGKCLIIYEPSNVKSGSLKIKYDFRTM